MYTETLTQRQGIANGIPPQVLNNAILNTTGIDLSKFRRAQFTLYIGAVTGGGSINCYLQESADNVNWTANGTAGAFANLRRRERLADGPHDREPDHHVRGQPEPANQRQALRPSPDQGETGSQNANVSA